MPGENIFGHLATPNVPPTRPGGGVCALSGRGGLYLILLPCVEHADINGSHHSVNDDPLQASLCTVYMIERGRNTSLFGSGAGLCGTLSVED